MDDQVGEVRVEADVSTQRDTSTHHVGPFDFNGRVVVVTGGSRGIGLATVVALLRSRAHVVTCSRHEPAPEDIPSFSDSFGTLNRAVFVEADIREADQARAVIDVAVKRFGKLDVLVNNAGGSPYSLAADVSHRFAASVVSLNLLAPFYCSQAANEVFQGQDSGGVIVNVGSVSGLRPSPGTALYGAAKAALVSLTSTLAVEWAPKTRVNCVSAGLIDSGGGLEHYGGAEGMDRVAETVPMGRLGLPSDVVNACMFLASPLCSYVTGANLVVHGGGEWPSFIAAAQR